MGETYGPLVRLWGVQPSQLPPAGARQEDLKPLLTSILQEALPFIASLPPPLSPSLQPMESAQPASPWHLKDVKNYPNTISPVHVFTRAVLASDLEAVVKEHNPSGVDSSIVSEETWALRRSIHEDNAAKGTACWGEFVKNIKEEHALAEKEYTPSVLGTKVDQEWDCTGIEIDFEGDTWADWTLKRESSTHKLPLLKNRLFPVFQATASVKGRREFLVVQIATRQEEGEEIESGMVRAAYTSIERVREVEKGLEWVMGTASDAKGIVPAWVQKLAVPGQIAKDVDLFMGWLGEQREKWMNVVGSEVEEADGIKTPA